uniref:mannose-6-phosphate isomerase n=1 Tax=Steinernema glaseri TaxID=37863 RepID=A0A1I7YFR6_9BILA
MERIDCEVKNYDWGKKGADSVVAHVFQAGHPHVKIDPNRPYAELWMGTHPDGPAVIRSTGRKLSTHIVETETGDNNNNLHTKRQELHLAFIQKLMSIQRTLSLQVHPTKEQAEWLHEQDPIHYPDRNHKPELAFALTRFELLCGFRPAQEIALNMRTFPELCVIMGVKNCIDFCELAQEELRNAKALKECLKRCIKTMLDMQVNQSRKVAEQLESLFYRINAKNVRGCLQEETVDVMNRTHDEFPGDVGCFAPLYVNHMILEPGECCYYGAGEIHAYLSGECIECVGCSNNTIRAALTPKYIDRENLVKILNYRMTKPDFYLVHPETISQFPHVEQYAPDCRDFTLHQIKISRPTSNSETFWLPTLSCGSILIVIEGNAYLDEPETSNRQRASRGDIIYIPPSAEVRFVDVEENVLAYRTFSFEEGPDHESRSEAAKATLEYRKGNGIVPDTIVNQLVGTRPFNRLIMTENDKHDFVFDPEMEADGFL